jgi:carboxymethylenebutenolidase
MPDITTSNVEFKTNGETAQGFLAHPDGDGPFPGVIVVQEWWGLDDHIKDVAQRFANEGFAAFAPDLYHGKIAAEPDEAQKLMMSLDMNRAAKELIAAAEHLTRQPIIAGRGIGATGFCMGGGLALTLACNSPHIKAAAPFYGVNPNPVDKVKDLNGPVLAIYAENDDFAGPSVRNDLETALKQHGKQYEIKTYPGTHHAFFNDTRPDVYARDAAADAWQRVLSLFRANL